MATKVVDQNGKPLAVYHGTTSAFSSFDEGKLDLHALFGPGFYFTEDPEVASGYAEAVDVKKRGFINEQDLADYMADNPSLTLKSQRKEKNPGRPPMVAPYDEIVAEFFDGNKYKPNVMPVYLNIENPFDMDKAWLSPEQLKSIGWDGFYGAYTGSLLRIIDNNPEHAKNLPAVLKTLGYDGITHMGGDRTGGKQHRVWIVFSAGQIVPRYGGEIKAWVRANCKFAQSGVQMISQQEAIDKGMFGPVYHGTSQANMDAIMSGGFQVFEGEARKGNVSHGYATNESYHNGIPPPIHHLGYGIYFTTVKNIGKQFNQGTAKGMQSFYLNVPRMETINLGAPKTMMNWWVQNGYDAALAKTDRVSATRTLTQTLAGKHDAVWFKGKGIFRLLDGDQICVYNPANIFMVDKTLTKPGDTGSKVRRNSDGMMGTILNIHMNQQKIETNRQHWNESQPGVPYWIKPNTTKIMSVKWQKGGTDHNVQDSDVTPV